MGEIASQITSFPIVYSTVYSGADQSKHQSWASLAFVWGIHRRPVNSPHKWPVTRKMFPFDDVIMVEHSLTGICATHCYVERLNHSNTTNLPNGLALAVWYQPLGQVSTLNPRVFIAFRINVSVGVWGPFHKRFFNSISTENLPRCNLITNNQIATNSFSCHDCTADELCAKFCSNRSVKIEVRAKQISQLIGISMENL